MGDQASSATFIEMNTPELAALLVTIGCPREKSIEMAAQLEKRAHQLAVAKGRSYEEALAHLLGLMKQGWAAQGGVEGLESLAAIRTFSRQ